MVIILQRAYEITLRRNNLAYRLRICLGMIRFATSKNTSV